MKDRAIRSGSGRAIQVAVVALAAFVLTSGSARARAPACGGVVVTGPAALVYQSRVCAVLERAGTDAALIDEVYIAPADGAGMLWPVNLAAGGALNCGEAPRAARQVTVRDHPACNLPAFVERFVAHELGHKRWEALNPGEAYGPRWEAEESYADGYADGGGWRW